MSVFDELHANANADNALLHLKDSTGDLRTIARDVGFDFRTTDWQAAQDVCDFINWKNLGRAMRTSDADTIRVSIVIHMPITQHVLCSVSGFMLCLGRLFGVDYEGWNSLPRHGRAATGKAAGTG